MRISGIDLPENKPIWIALTYLYGIGRNNVVAIIKEAKVEAGKKVKDLTGEEIGRISKVIETVRIEGDLRKEEGENIKRLKEIGSYRGSRHSKNLPSRGQRTRSNARTKRGKRVTIGAMKKDVMTKTDQAQDQKPAKS